MEKKISYFALRQDRVLTKDRNGEPTPGHGIMSFNSYTDITGVFGNAGLPVFYIEGHSMDGRPRYKHFTLSQQHNVFQVREGQKDTTGKSMFEFLRNHPQCEGSPNGKYTTDGRQIDVVFKLMDEDKDADVALEAIENVNKAVMSVLSLDEQTLAEMAILTIGVHGSTGNLVKFQLSEWAKKRPLDYFKILNNNDRFIRAIIRRAVKDGVLQTKGEVHYWGSEMIGGNEDSVVSYLTTIDPKLLDVLKEAVKLTEPVAEKKKGPGRPANKVKS